jgi:hypothetical protein
MIACNALVLAWALSGAIPGATVFWATSPVAPGETVVLPGAGLADTKHIVVARLPDGKTGEPTEARPDDLPKPERIVPPEQVSEISLKFILPGAGEAGLYPVQLISEARHSEVFVLNRPDLRWVQGDAGPEATQGGWVRAFGSCLAAEEEHSPPAWAVHGPTRSQRRFLRLARRHPQGPAPGRLPDFRPQWVRRKVRVERRPAPAHPQQIGALAAASSQRARLRSVRRRKGRRLGSSG